MTIDVALQQVEAGDHAGALATLLDEWRETRSRVIADTIDLLAKELTTHEPPIVAVGKTSERKAWDDVLRAKRPAAFNRLLEALPHNARAPERIVDIAHLPHDPRITSFAREWLTTRAPSHNENRVPFFKLLLVILRRNDDARILETLSEITAPSERKATIRHIGLMNWKPVLEVTAYLTTVDAKQKEPQSTATLSLSDRDALRRIEELVAVAKPRDATGTVTTDPRELFARVYANPDDDEPRAVLGDLLQQLGDPRGELIAFQLARYGVKKKRTPRERELETQWGVTWLGPLAEYVYQGVDGFEFERGFPAHVRLSGVGIAPAPLKLLEEWATITEIDVRDRSGGVDDGVATLLTAPVMRALRHVRGLGSTDFETICAAKQALPWKTLGLAPSSQELEACCDGPKGVFGDVTKLTLDFVFTPEQVNRVIQKWSAMSELEIAFLPGQGASILASEPFRRLDRLVMSTYGLTVVVTKANPKLLHLAATEIYSSTEAKIVQLLGLLFGLTRTAFDHVHIGVGGLQVSHKDNALVHGRWQKLDLTEIRRITRNAAVDLTLLKEKVQ